MTKSNSLHYKGHAAFRQRLVMATLSGKALRITDIRSDDEDAPGLADYEASFLRLIEKMTNGSIIEINYTGTAISYRPGVLIGGSLQHDCPPSRSIGYFLESILCLAPFCKRPVTLTLTGVTNNNLDPSVDFIRTVHLPLLKLFGLDDNIELKINKRGAPPKAGGDISFTCPVIRQLKPLQFIDPGKIKRIRGIAYATRVSPTMPNRVLDTARSLLTPFTPDVYIYSDMYKGAESGNSPGYGLTLVAESTTGALLSAEACFEPRPPSTSTQDSSHFDTSEPAPSTTNKFNFPTPELLSQHVTSALLHQISSGACFDTSTQYLPLLFMSLSPQDVSQIRLGKLSPFTVQYLRDIKDFLGVVFKVTPEHDTKTVLLSCFGSGFSNTAKNVT
ncbi:RNA 3'-terminal phosphate cyclase/enolpyruvate transferase [Phlyctochytrium arcticum]|nr:RNA 3'-terminal phosphate cyclase/enolpyruvate transferase [Phlyctochytrium arcticum]